MKSGLVRRKQQRWESNLEEKLETIKENDVLIMNAGSKRGTQANHKRNQHHLNQHHLNQHHLNQLGFIKPVSNRTQSDCQCMHDLRPASNYLAQNTELLTEIHEVNNISARCREDTFIIDSMVNANRSESPSRDSMVSVSSALSQSTSNVNYPSLASSTVTTRCSMYSNKTSLNDPQKSSAKVTIISEVKPVSRKQPLPLEQLLDYDNAARKVAIKCTKYNEIGNPHARKGKTLKRLPSSKKWNQKVSYTLDTTNSESATRDSVNFMDKQSNGIYNSSEKARIDKHLISRKKQTDQLATLTKQLAAPQVHWYYLEVTQQQRQANVNRSALSVNASQDSVKGMNPKTIPTLLLTLPKEKLPHYPKLDFITQQH